MLEYKKAQSTVVPDEVDTTSSKTTVYLRKNIVEKETTNEASGETYATYEYDECQMTKAEYQAYLTEKQRADIDYIALMTGVDLEEV